MKRVEHPMAVLELNGTLDKPPCQVEMDIKIAVRERQLVNDLAGALANLCEVIVKGFVEKGMIPDSSAFAFIGAEISEQLIDALVKTDEEKNALRETVASGALSHKTTAPALAATREAVADAMRASRDGNAEAAVNRLMGVLKQAADRAGKPVPEGLAKAIEGMRGPVDTMRAAASEHNEAVLTKLSDEEKAAHAEMLTKLPKPEEPHDEWFKRVFGRDPRVQDIVPEEKRHLEPLVNSIYMSALLNGKLLGKLSVSDLSQAVLIGATKAISEAVEDETDVPDILTKAAIWLMHTVRVNQMIRSSKADTIGPTMGTA